MARINLDRFRDVDLVIDKANDNFIAKQWTSVGDKSGRTLTVMITNGGIVGELTGATVSLLWTNKANGLTDETAFLLKDKDTSTFVIEYPSNMLTSGTVVAQIRVWYNGKTITTKPFEITVSGIAGQMAGVVKQQEFGLLTDMLADANKLRTDIDNKADVAIVSDQIATVNNRLDNIIATGTPIGNTELIDGRLQSDGVIAPTIGSAIRQQNAISASKNAINEAGKIDILTNEKLVTINPFNYFQGSYALNNGQFEENDTEAARNIRIKSSIVKFRGKSVTFIPKSGYEISLVVIKKTSIPGKYELQHSSGWTNEKFTLKTSDELYFRFIVRASNGSAIYRENINNYLTIYQPNEIVLTVDFVRDYTFKNEGTNNYIDQHQLEYLDVGTTYNVSKYDYKEINENIKVTKDENLTINLNKNEENTIVEIQ